jgi:hypothetical protein
LALGRIKHGNGDYAGAHTMFKDAQALNPESPNTHNSLMNLYAEVGLFDLAAPFAQTPDEKGSLLIMRGDIAAARKIIAENPDKTALTALLLGETAAAYPELRKQASQINFVALPVTQDIANYMVFIAMLFQEQSDPDAEVLIDKLNVYFTGKTPADFTNGNVLFSAGLLAIVNDSTEQALPWFERMANVGYAWAGVENVSLLGMGGLRQYPQWLEIEKRLIENAAKHRALIEAQLANPKPNWVKNK